MIAGLFASVVLALFALIVIAHGGLAGFVLFGLALLTAISGVSNPA